MIINESTFLVERKKLSETVLKELLKGLYLQTFVTYLFGAYDEHTNTIDSLQIFWVNKKFLYIKGYWVLACDCFLNFLRKQAQLKAQLVIIKIKKAQYSILINDILLKSLIIKRTQSLFLKGSNE